MADLAGGTVTFLITDVEGATRMLDQHPEAGGRALARHAVLISEVIEEHGGVVFSRGGDNFSAVFASSADAVAAALEAQRRQLHEPCEDTGQLKVRMALYTGAAELRGGDYQGRDVYRAHRLAALARGGQVLLSQSTQELVADSLPSGVRLRDLGEYPLRDFERPEHVFQLLAPELPDDSALSRVLATILITDIVNSTATAATLGDLRWRAVLAAHHALVREALPRFRGREVRTTGDGFFAAFDTPTLAIECARTIVDGVFRIGVEIRAGVHSGECELVGQALEGLAVHIAARIEALAEPGEVLVSSTVKELVTGSGIDFVDRGSHTFKGVPGEWRLFAVAHAPRSLPARMTTDRAPPSANTVVDRK
jgi:class 3 adenylate cyclase